jgi:dephospho-CoA kinase
MIVVGLTGSIGMGKSTVAIMLRRMGIRVFDADAEVHALQAAGGGAVREIVAAFPTVALSKGAIDRKSLAGLVLGDRPALRRLEAILHPKVRAARKAFLARAAREGEKLVVLDIPLLFEGGEVRGIDAVLLVSAPAFLQRQRVLRRPGMSVIQFERILGLQVPDRDKRRRTRYILETGIGKRHTLIALCRHLRTIVYRDETLGRRRLGSRRPHPRRPAR